MEALVGGRIRSPIWPWCRIPGLSASAGRSPSVIPKALGGGGLAIALGQPLRPLSRTVTSAIVPAACTATSTAGLCRTKRLDLIQDRCGDQSRESGAATINSSGEVIGIQHLGAPDLGRSGICDPRSIWPGVWPTNCANVAQVDPPLPRAFQTGCRSRPAAPAITTRRTPMRLLQLPDARWRPGAWLCSRQPRRTCRPAGTWRSCRFRRRIFNPGAATHSACCNGVESHAVGEVALPLKVVVEPGNCSSRFRPVGPAPPGMSGRLVARSRAPFQPSCLSCRTRLEKGGGLKRHVEQDPRWHWWLGLEVLVQRGRLMIQGPCAKLRSGPALRHHRRHHLLQGEVLGRRPRLSPCRASNAVDRIDLAIDGADDVFWTALSV